jgi:hypothetical protein
MTPSGPIFRLVFIILLVVGAPFVLIALSEIVQINAAYSRGQATGTVVDNSYSTTQDGTTVSGAYYPVVDFTTAAGETIRFTDGAGSLPPDYEIGATVPVLYDPAGVERPRLASWKRLWLVPTLFIVLGLLPATVFGLWLAITTVQARRRPRPAHLLY